MKSTLAGLLLAANLSLISYVIADDRIDHFEGKPSATLEEAVANFSEYNGRLAALLEKKALTPTDLGTIHELTYTLENALGKINEQLGSLAETLELLHKASENVETDAVRKHGSAYLKIARELVP